jgi:hypothetical protein
MLLSIIIRLPHRWFHLFPAMCFVFFAVCENALTQSLPMRFSLPTEQIRNFDLCDSLLRFSSHALAKQLRRPLFPQDTLHIAVIQHEGSWMLENALFADIPKAKRFRPIDSVRNGTKLSVRITDLSTRYFAVPENFDMLSREISCVLAASIETRDGAIQALEPISYTLRDTISRQHISTLENKQYSFTTAHIPEAAPNLWKKVIEPAVVILAGALVVLLFFLVRTQ